MTEKKKEYLTPAEVATLLMVSPITVRQWAQKGKITSMITPGGHRRFLREDLLRFARERGLALSIPDHSLQRILVVDDHIMFARSLAKLLELTAPPITIEIANDGFEAGRKIQTFQPHVILLDLMMPGINGFEVCKRLKDDPATKAIRVVAMTGFPSADSEARILSAGAEICLVKPFDRSTLLEAIGVEAVEVHSKPTL